MFLREHLCCTLLFSPCFISGLPGYIYLLIIYFSCLLKGREGQREREETLVKPIQDHLEYQGYRVTYSH